MNKFGKFKKPECPECGGHDNYFRMGAKEHVCKVCGNTFRHPFKKAEKVPEPPKNNTPGEEELPVPISLDEPVEIPVDPEKEESEDFVVEDDQRPGDPFKENPYPDFNRDD